MLDKTDGSRVIPQFNLAQYLAENQDRADGVAPFIGLQFAEAKATPVKTYGDYPKCVTLPDGQQFVAKDEAHETQVTEAYNEKAEAQRLADEAAAKASAKAEADRLAAIEADRVKAEAAAKASASQGAPATGGAGAPGADSKGKA